MQLWCVSGNEQTRNIHICSYILSVTNQNHKSRKKKWIFFKHPGHKRLLTVCFLFSRKENILTCLKMEEVTLQPKNSNFIWKAQWKVVERLGKWVHGDGLFESPPWQVMVSRDQGEAMLLKWYLGNPRHPSWKKREFEGRPCPWKSNLGWKYTTTPTYSSSPFIKSHLSQHVRIKTRMWLFPKSSLVNIVTIGQMWIGLNSLSSWFFLLWETGERKAIIWNGKVSF